MLTQPFISSVLEFATEDDLTYARQPGGGRTD
jgi:hypothetical protein